MMFDTKQVHGTLKLFKVFYDKALEADSRRYVVNSAKVCKHLGLEKETSVKTAKQLINNFNTLKPIYRLAEVTDITLKRHKNKDGIMEPIEPATLICRIFKVKPFHWYDLNVTKLPRNYKHGGIVTSISKPGKTEPPYKIITK